jgi:hypothetical protein
LVRIIDKLSYWSFVYLFLGGIIICWLLFYFLSPAGNGIVSTVCPKNAVSLFDAFYFSVVTISSLGYGDFRPVGFGRVVAILEVVYGLLIIALIVSKIASERTATLVRLVYTSDIEQRVREYTEENNRKNVVLRNAIRTHDFDAMHSIIYGFRVIFTAYLHFFIFQKKEGYIDGRWAEKIFLKLLRSTRASIEIIAEISRLNNLTQQERNNCSKAMNRARVFSSALIQYYTNQNIHQAAGHIGKTITDCSNYLKKLESGNAHPVTLTELNDELIEKVRKEFSTIENLDNNTHKAIAKNLRISNSLAQRAISLIIGEENA